VAKETLQPNSYGACVLPLLIHSILLADSGAGRFRRVGRTTESAGTARSDVSPAGAATIWRQMTV
jgi:hypothetical protein